jgi:uncharacterized membrane protein
MAAMPVWALVLAYWLHMIGTVLWLGSLTTFVLMVLPAAGHTLEIPAQIAFLDSFQRRLESIATFSLFLLLATGMFQMSANKYFTGLFSTENLWGTAILIKHALFLVMIVVNSIVTWGLFPAFRRALIRYRRNGEISEFHRLQSREMLFIQIMLVISALILIATAVARSA